MRTALLAGALLIASGPALQAGAQERFDLLVRGGTLCDGTSAEPRAADVGIVGGRITRVGSLPGAGRGTGHRGEGGLVAPGFIDVHTHADDIADHPQAENFARMGVTSIVAGNCGSSALDVGEALDRVKEAAPINFATLVGHNTVRAR